MKTNIARNIADKRFFYKLDITENIFQSNKNFLDQNEGDNKSQPDKKSFG